MSATSASHAHDVAWVCGAQVCGLPDDFKPWLEDDLEAMLHALCEKYPSICPRSFADADLNLAEGCRVYNTLEVVLLIGIVVGSGLLACACMVALCRALLSCWRGNRYHVQLRDDGACRGVSFPPVPRFRRG